MAQNFLLTGELMWSYEEEVAAITAAEKTMRGLTGLTGPMHHHSGTIALTEEYVLIESNADEDDLIIPLSSITQLYLGFDDVYTNYSVKNFGLFWQPLRLEFTNSHHQPEKVYLIIDYMMLYTQNKKWYDALTSILA
ncbi:hypothetical protein D0C36_08930 [Mucilaginibacter conchicola]|uniref:Uncharacterized protein n=1 Tax=Mucilaginibacter conchicola TaxID=2303333 RepID=A0A372NZT0_9SPHI|nr:hypothetical protein [Mucilaginibacter conchicola]RFZ95623.1 hypothetical protein D0C36_08930 [Mucilaginibacter conchicola]